MENSCQRIAYTSRFTIAISISIIIIILIIMAISMPHTCAGDDANKYVCMT